MTKAEVVLWLLERGLPPEGWKHQIIKRRKGGYGLSGMIAAHSQAHLQKGEGVVAEIHGDTANLPPEKAAEALLETLTEQGFLEEGEKEDWRARIREKRVGLTKEEVVEALLEGEKIPEGWTRWIVRAEGESYWLTDLLLRDEEAEEYLEEPERLVAKIGPRWDDLIVWPQAYFDRDRVAELILELGGSRGLALAMRLNPVKTWFKMGEENRDLVNALESHPEWGGILEGADRGLIVELLAEEGFIRDEEKKKWLMKAWGKGGAR